MFTLDSTRQTPLRWLTPIAFMLLLLGYHLIFGRLFPDFQGQLSRDYSVALPSLLNGYFWFKSNSLLDVPWFSPSFCGGQPFFADVQSMYYSVPQLLTLFVNPLTSVYLSILLFASAGFWFMYVLLRQLFCLGTETAFLGSALFMFNGFYAHRMVVGHLGFQGIMLTPFVVFFLLRPVPKGEGQFKLASLLYATWVSLCLTYWLHSGLTSLIIPVSLAVLAVVCLYSPTSREWRVFLERTLVAGLIALALCASKLVAGLAFMSHFQRNDYLLPGVEGIANAVGLILTTLFYTPTNIEQIATPKLRNLQWVLGPHEWDYSVTVFPLAIIMLTYVTKFFSRKKSDNHPKLSPPALILLGVVLIIPLALNIYTPQWNAILKQTPLLKSSSSLIRWWLIYIPVVIVYAVIALERCDFLKYIKTQIVVIGVFGILYLNAYKYLPYFHQDNYHPDTIIAAYQHVASGGAIPKIEQIVAFGETNGHLLTRFNPNDSLAFGGSQMFCYNPSFGYLLEKLPLKSLHIGSIYEQTKGELNIKNPACYVFPTENHCEPGGHFSVGEKSQAEAFAQYKPFSFAISRQQKIANLITQFALLIITGFLGFTASFYFNQVTKRYRKFLWT
ncbi:MAG: hypothetical protein PHO08_01930 [Methylococcales bacterium]|nr:hypothetical protein [Methylococcales bacterium]